jgi:hypothetical protein
MANNKNRQKKSPHCAGFLGLQKTIGLSEERGI